MYKQEKTDANNLPFIKQEHVGISPCTFVGI